MVGSSNRLDAERKLEEIQFMRLAVNGEAKQVKEVMEPLQEAAGIKKAKAQKQSGPREMAAKLSRRR